MSGRPVHLIAAATIAAAASLFAITSASASCYSCGSSYTYAAPVTYTAPVVYSTTYAAPVTYAQPVSYAANCGCGYASYGFAARPMYVVNQGPAYNAPVGINAEPTPEVDYGYGYRRSPRYYGDVGVGWRGRSWGYRHGYRGYRGGYGYRFGVKRYRYGAVVPGRYSMRHPIVGPGGIHRGPRMHREMHHMHRGMHRMHQPRHWTGAVPPHRMGPKPGSVHPMGGPKKKLP